MQLSRINNLAPRSKTNNISNPRHVVKTNYNNISDTFTFGAKNVKIKPVGQEVKKFSQEIQDAINEVIKLIETEGPQTRRLSKTETAIAEKLPNGEFKITFASENVDDITMTTNKGLIDIVSIGKENPEKVIKYEGVSDGLLIDALPITLKKYFLNTK